MATKTRKTALYLLLEQLLGEPLDKWIATQRAQDMSYHKIAYRLTEKTGVDVTLEAVRRWHHWAQEETTAQAA